MRNRLRLMTAALCLLGTALPCLAFNPQPDPPAKLIWRNIDLPGAAWTWASGINAAGQIAGYTYDGVSESQGFLRSGNQIDTFGVPGSVGNHGELYGLNNVGQVVGRYSDGRQQLGFLHDASGYHDLNPGGSAQALAINDAGFVVGSTADANGVVSGWSWNGNSFAALNHASASRTVPLGVDNQGTVYGLWDDAAGQTRGFIRNAGGVDTDVEVAGSFGTVLFGANSHGTIVGEWWAGDVVHGMLLVGDHYMSIDIPGAVSTAITGINDDGTLVGIYSFEDRGPYHAFVGTLAPVPEPSSAALLLVGGLAVLGWRRRRAAPLLLCALLGTGAAQAASDHWVQAFVDARGGGVTLQDDSGQVAGPQVNAGPIGFNVVDQFGSFSNSIQASATYGHLWGSAFAAQNSPVFARQSDANADYLAFQDRITLLSATLPQGTAVDLSVTMQLTDKLSAGPNTCCSNVAVNGHGNFVFAYGDQAQAGQTIDHQVVQTKAMTWFIGQPNDVGAILFFDVGSSPGCCVSFTGGSRVDLADVQFWLNLPQDVSLQSASGASYAAPVPEPGSALLMVAGVALLLVRRHSPA